MSASYAWHYEFSAGPVIQLAVCDPSCGASNRPAVSQIGRQWTQISIVKQCTLLVNLWLIYVHDLPPVRIGTTGGSGQGRRYELSATWVNATHGVFRTKVWTSR
jgi:hypothetical protein